MRVTGNAGALLLFDISGFFNNMNPEYITHVFHLKGFSQHICDWVLSFLKERKVMLKMGTTMLDPCDIHNGTP
jgi:hypothetical protein